MELSLVQNSRSPRTSAPLNLREDRMDGNRCTDRTAGEQGARERDDSMEEKADSWTINKQDGGSNEQKPIARTAGKPSR